MYHCADLQEILGWFSFSMDQLNHYFSHLYRELSRFIAAGRLHCKIDKVGGIVETNR